jgi:hypothetical protein
MRLRHLPRETSRLVRRALGFKRKPPEELAPIMDRLRPGDTFVDIGAHEGLFSTEDRVLLPFFKAAPGELWPSWVMIERSHNVWAHDCIEFMQQRGYGEAWSGRSDTLLAKPVAASS